MGWIIAGDGGDMWAPKDRLLRGPVRGNIDISSLMAGEYSMHLWWDWNSECSTDFIFSK